MIGELCEILEGFGYPVFRQGSLNPEPPYPDSFFTFWNFETPESAFYDNDANLAVWGFWVYFYSVDPMLTEHVIEDARRALKQAGWTPAGKPIDVKTDTQTHTGRMFTVRKIENFE